MPAAAATAQAIAVPVDVQLATHSTTPSAAAIEAWALAALAGAPACRHLPRPAVHGELCVRVVDAAEGRALNRDYRHTDAPTNVLSFPADVALPDGAPAPLLLGDVVVCAPVVRQEAAAQGKAYDDHFAHMIVHGVLHLLGYDHQSDAQASVMEEFEREILGRCGMSDPYGEG